MSVFAHECSQASVLWSACLLFVILRLECIRGRIPRHTKHAAEPPTCIFLVLAVSSRPYQHYVLIRGYKENTKQRNLITAGKEEREKCPPQTHTHTHTHPYLLSPPRPLANTHPYTRTHLCSPVNQLT